MKRGRLRLVSQGRNASQPAPQQLQPKLVLPVEIHDQDPQLQQYVKLAEVALKDSPVLPDKKSA